MASHRGRSRRCARSCAHLQAARADSAANTASQPGPESDYADLSGPLALATPGGAQVSFVQIVRVERLVRLGPPGRLILAPQVSAASARGSHIQPASFPGRPIGDACRASPVIPSTGRAYLGEVCARTCRLIALPGRLPAGSVPPLVRTPLPSLHCPAGAGRAGELILPLSAPSLPAFLSDPERPPVRRPCSNHPCSSCSPLYVVKRAVSLQSERKTQRAIGRSSVRFQHLGMDQIDRPSAFHHACYRPPDRARSS